MKMSLSIRMLGAVAALAVVLAAGTAQAQVKISAIYPGGGNAGATYNQDYIELYNTGASSQDINGWSLQYGSATGTTIAVKNSFTVASVIPAGGYYLVATGSVSTLNGVALPTAADATFLTGIGLGATGGRLFLVNVDPNLANSTTPSGPTIVDFVGYGNSTVFEGTAAAPAPGGTTFAIFRAGAGATDSNDNAADFAAALVDGSGAAPSRLPRNTTFGASAVEDWTLLN